MSSLDDMLAGIDAWSNAESYPKKTTTSTSKPTSTAKPITSAKPALKQPLKSTAAPKKVVKKRKLDDSIEKTSAEVPESEKQKKAKALLEKLIPKDASLPLISSLGDEPLIISAEQCTLAVEEIMKDEKNRILAVDCEGVNLGRNGRLCLVQIATPTKSYLFDIIEGGAALFDSGLRQLLENPDFVKVMHDCRLDSDALFHEHKVNLANVFDTQVAYAVVTRGKGYSTPLPVGLNTLLKHYAHGAANEVKDHMKQAMQADSEYWLKRPMDENALKYARQDVTFLCTVQRQIDALLSVASRKSVVHYSNHYLDQIRTLEAAIEREQPDPNKKEERFIPKYGIKEWDLDCALNLERSAGRRRR